MQSFENQDLNACLKLQKNTRKDLSFSHNGSIINSSQNINTSKIINRKDPVSSEKDYSLLVKRKNSNQNDRENLKVKNSCNINYTNASNKTSRNIKSFSLQRNNLSLFPILEDDEIKGEIYT